MLTINKNTTQILKQKINEASPKFTKGNKLENVIEEVLADQDIFLFLAKYTINDSGLILGKMQYFDDIKIEVFYGLTINRDYQKNLETNIFSFKNIPLSVNREEPTKTLRKGRRLSQYQKQGINHQGYPSAIEFVKQLNKVLQNPNGNWVDFNKEYPAGRC